MAANLLIPKAPASLQIAFDTKHPDEEEYNGLTEHDTVEVISEQEYIDIHNRMGRTAIPSMNIFNIKTDSEGRPKHAKLRVVVLGDKDPVEWTKAECYTPVVSQPIVRLLTSLAV